MILKNPFSKKTAFSLIELSITILVVGILIAGAMGASKMFQKFQLLSARTLTQSSPVSSIPGLTLWLESTAEKSFDDSETIDKSPVSNWYDINPQSLVNKNTVSQATLISKPLYSGSAINGLPALKFDGANDCLFKSNVLGSDIVSYNQVTIFLVSQEMSSGSAGVAASALGWNSPASGGDERKINIHDPYSNAIYFDFGGINNGRIMKAVPNVSFNKIPQQMTFLRNSAGYQEFRMNGALQTGGNGHTATINEGFSSTFAVGSVNCVNTWFNGFLGEIIFYNRALTAEEKVAVESYLMKKWGIKS